MLEAIGARKIVAVTKSKAAVGKAPKKPKSTRDEAAEASAVRDEEQKRLGRSIDERC